jgi:hypothetical protein
VRAKKNPVVGANPRHERLAKVTASARTHGAGYLRQNPNKSHIKNPFNTRTTDKNRIKKNSLSFF